MQTVKNIIRKGLATKGNGFKIAFEDLQEKAGMTRDELCIALNTITQWNAWDMVITE